MSIYNTGVTTIRIHRQSLEGINSLDKIPNVKYIYIQHSNGFYKYQINQIIVDPEDSNAFYMDVKPEHGTPPTGSASSALVFSPYIAGKFKNSDFDSLLSNASENQASVIFQVVDNNESQLTPTNLSAINTRTAGFAQIQDGNYSTDSYKNIRYDGVKHTANDFNLQSNTGLIPVDWKTPYFCIFDYISGFSPEHNQANAIVIKYIVYEDGSVISPSSTLAQPILEQAFPENSKFNISLQGASAGGSEARLLGEHSSLKGGQRIEPLLYSYTAATYLSPQHTGTEKLQFQGDPTLEKYDAKVSASATQNITDDSPGDITQLLFQQEVTDVRGNYNTGNSTYTFNQDTEQPVKFSFYGRVHGTGYVDGYDGREEPLELTLRIQKSTDGDFNNINTTTTLVQRTVDVTSTNSATVNMQSDFANFSTGDQIRVYLEVGGLGTSISVNSNRVFRAISETPSSVTVDIASNGYFFATSSNSSNTYLTASEDLSQQYGRLFEGISGSLTTSGFNTPNLTFEPQRGDEIKFNGLENRTYLITEVITPSENADDLLYLKLNSKPGSTSNPDFFAIRRYVPTSNIVLMSIPRVVGTSKNGILFPKFPSEKLEKDYEFIISELERKQIL